MGESFDTWKRMSKRQSGHIVTTPKTEPGREVRCEAARKGLDMMASNMVDMTRLK